MVEYAIQSDSVHCWIAETLAEYPGVSKVIVDRQLIVFSHAPSGKRYTYFTPPIAIDANLMFDKGKADEMPLDEEGGFTFKLRNPRQIRNRRLGGGKREKARIAPESNHKTVILGGRAPRRSASMMRKYGSRRYEG